MTSSARRAALLLLAVGLSWVTLRETYDPRLRLFVDDLLGRALEPVEVAVGGGLSLRLYADPRPHIGKVDELQKGVVLVAGGEELIEEGFGFGVPIVRYGERTYNSRTAQVEIVQDAEGARLVKQYEVDVVDLPSRPFRRKYSDVPSWGVVVVTTTVLTEAEGGAARLAMSADLSGLAPGWTEAFLMNEQGAVSFRQYQPDAAVDAYTSPGIWEESRAPCSCWRNPETRLQFCVGTARDRAKYVGRERYTQYHWIGTYRLSWSGIDLHVEPDEVVLDYLITVGYRDAVAEDVVDAFCP